MSKKHSKSSRRTWSSDEDDSRSSRKKSNNYKYESKRTRRRSSSSVSSQSSNDSGSRKFCKSNNKSSRSRRRDFESSDSRSSSSDSRRQNKSSKKSHGKQSRSSNSMSRSPVERFREKNYDFKDGLDELYKNESKLRQKEISKIDKESEGFKPKEFKSSRSNRKLNDDAKKSARDENEHEKAMFGQTTTDQILNSINQSLSSTGSGMNLTNEKSLMHPNLFEDIQTKENRWKLKVVEYLKKFDN